MHFTAHQTAQRNVEQAARSVHFQVMLLTLAACGALAAGGAAQPPVQPPPKPQPDPAARAELLLVHHVLPLLKRKCLGCHGEGDELRGQLDLRTRAGMLKGGESGPSLTPGKPRESLLLQAVRWDGVEMPPKQNDRLTAEQIERWEQWIAAGAPWPEPQRLAALAETPDPWAQPDGVRAATSGGLDPAWTNRLYQPEALWAYQPLAPPTLDSDDTGRAIDALIESHWKRDSLVPAPPADRRTLIRRATFDLLGLPPTPKQIDSFLADPAPTPEAFARLVDRLLESPHYGEQWGRHWLDVVRYADSSGYANDYERGPAWRYRDYVVRAFNNDKPYDQFILEQIAGDELPEDEPDAGAGAAAVERRIAVGMLRMGPWELTGMEVPKVARQRFLDDVTDAVGQVFLGHMLQCARCHDHKFDPIPTRDYYAIQACFATTQQADCEAPFLPTENLQGFEERKYLLQRMEHYERTLRELNSKHTLAAARRWLADESQDAGPFETTVAKLARAAGGEDQVRLDAVRKRMASDKVDPALIPPRHVGFEPADFGMERVARKGIERLKWRLDRYEPRALSVYSGRTPSLRSVNQPLRIPPRPLEEGELEPTAILAGGDPFSPTIPVRPGVLSVIARSAEPDQLEKAPAAGAEEPGAALSAEAPLAGRRLELARWIASADNPLTARVMVNRIWQWHFGRPLAGNPNNLGFTGQRPTHPLLLDHLAAMFIQEGWSVKAMHRRIMNTAAYRRGSRPAAPSESDAAWAGYAAFRPRRLDAEELRDAILSVTGELNRTLGGIPVRPEMNLEAALQPRQVMGTFAEAWQPSPLPEQRHRRSLYAQRIRGQRDPLLEVFNAPSPDVSCEARESSTVTPQVFALFNSQASYDRAIALASRLWPDTSQPDANRPDTSQQAGKGKGESQPTAPADRAEAIDRLFRLALGRAPRADERAACLAHWERMTARHRGLSFQAPDYPREVVRQAVEENTGETFTFSEPLEAFVDFVPDRKPQQCTPEQRGLAEVCLVLLNSNEFCHLD